MRFTGYDPKFLGKPIEFPELSESHTSDVVRLFDEHNGIIPYVNYSLILSRTEKFPLATASNIDGALFKRIPRVERWKKDPRVVQSQWGRELYVTQNSRFDRGHMVKREDVQWGKNEKEALKAAESTFFYCNAVPQHKNLNRKIWRSLESYVLNTEAVRKELKLSVFTGPVLSNLNPIFVETISKEQVRIPVLFWKIIYFKKTDGHIYRAAFLMSQKSLLEKDGLVHELESSIVQDDLFLQFKAASTYQVNVSTIEKVTGLRFSHGFEPYTDTRPIKLILQKVDVDDQLESFVSHFTCGFNIPNIIL